MSGRPFMSLMIYATIMETNVIIEGVSYLIGGDRSRMTSSS